MYWKGHCGVSLAAFAPVGFAFVRLGAPELAVASGAVMVGLAMLPDVDHRLPWISHRGVTHTLAFAALVGAAFGAAGGAVATAAAAGPLAALDPAPALGSAVGSLSRTSPATLGFAAGFGLGFLTVVAHLLADALTPMGVPFLWPLSSKRYTLSLWYAANPLANVALFALGVFVVVASLYLSLSL